MSEAITLRYTVPPAMLRRAMTSWATPHRSKWARTGRIALQILAGLLVGGLLAVTGVFGMMPDGFWTGALAGFYAGLLLWLIVHRRQHRNLAAFSTDALERTGEVEARFDARTIVMHSNLGETRYRWVVLDDVFVLADATVLRMGGVVTPIPDAALPDGLTPDAFRQQLHDWREAAG